jgi:fluoroquinolone transport system ATP-binding protein
MIDVKELHFTYIGTTEPAVQQLDFKVSQGEIFGFLGPSGAGKSTTQKILNGLLKGYEGHVSVLGKELADWNSDYYEKIGVSFELPNHYLKLTAMENLTYFSSLYQGDTYDSQSLLDMVGLSEDGNMYVSQFSKGMKNRLSVARSILHHPDLIFMDEPTAGLDPVNARRIKELISKQQEAGKTIFLTTHDMHVADELCDRVAFIVEGHVKLIDSPHALKLQYSQSKVEVEYLHHNQTETQEFPLDNLGTNPDFWRC